MIIKEKRSLIQIIRGIFNRLLHIPAYISFPTNVTVFLHRMRGVKIGKNTYIGRLVSIDQLNPEMIEIGNEVAISEGVIILAHQRDLSFYKAGMSAMHNKMIVKKVKINDGAHIGVGAIVLPGVTIGKGAVIGAGAVVNKDIDDYSIAVGVPAQVIKKIKN